MSWPSEPFNLHLNNVSNIKVLSKLLNAFFISHNARCPHVQRAIDSIVLIVLYECLNYCSLLKLGYILNVSVYECISFAKPCISHYLRKDSHLFVVLLLMLVELMNELEWSILLLHFLVDHGQINDILGRIVNHVLCKRSHLPKSFVVLHLSTDLMFLGVNDINIGFK